MSSKISTSRKPTKVNKKTLASVLNQQKACYFCGEIHVGEKPPACAARGEIVRRYIAAAIEKQGEASKWKVFRAIENGLINVDQMARALLKGKIK